MIHEAFLENVTEFVLDGTHASPERTDGGVRVLSAQNVKQGFVDIATDRFTSEAEFIAFRRRLSIHDGDVLLTIVGSIGRCAVVDGLPSVVFQRSVAVLRPRSGCLDSRFLYHCIQSEGFQRQLVRATNQSAQAGVYLGKLKRLTIPLPPLNEQRRIAAILDEADALRAKRRAAIVKLDELPQAIFYEMFGDPVTNPMGWPQVAIKDICHVKGGKRLPKGDEYSDVPTPYRFVRVVVLKGGQIDEAGLLYLKPETQRQIARYTVAAGDVVISIAGSIGLIAPVEPSVAGANLTENAAKLVPKEISSYNSDYLAGVLRLPGAQAQFVAQTGQVTIGKLALFRIEQICMPLPPFELQQRYATVLGLVRQHQKQVAYGSDSMDVLFASLQHRAFRGEL